MMSLRESEHTCWIPQPFDSGLKTVRHALAEAGLSILGEFDFSGNLGGEMGVSTPSRILYVDAPLLLFEALALDRAPAVFIPLHVLVFADGERTRICWANAAAVLGVRLPAGAAAPIGELQERVTQALATVGSLESMPASSRPRRAARTAMVLKKGVHHYV